MAYGLRALKAGVQRSVRAGGEQGRAGVRASDVAAPRTPWWRRLRPPRRLSFTREGRIIVILSVGVGFAAINTGNNLLYLLLGWLLSFIIASGILSELTLQRLTLPRPPPPAAGGVGGRAVPDGVGDPQRQAQARVVLDRGRGPGRLDAARQALLL